MKFCFHDIQIEFVIDQEKKNVAAVYISRISTGEMLSQSSPAVTFISDERVLAEEVAKRAAEAGLI